MTHVVSEGNAAQELWMWLEDHGLSEAHDTHVLNISWFTESMSAGRPLPVEMRHHIPVSVTDMFNITDLSHMIYPTNPELTKVEEIKHFV